MTLASLAATPSITLGKQSGVPLRSSALGTSSATPAAPKTARRPGPRPKKCAQVGCVSRAAMQPVCRRVRKTKGPLLLRGETLTRERDFARGQIPRAQRRAGAIGHLVTPCQGAVGVCLIHVQGPVQYKILQYTSQGTTHDRLSGPSWGNNVHTKKNMEKNTGTEARTHE